MHVPPAASDSGPREPDRLLAVAQPHPTWTTDQQGRVLAINAALLSYCGLGEDTLVGRSLEHLVHPEDQDQLQPPHGVQEHQTELRMRGHDGQYRWFQLDTRALPGTAAAGAWITAATDIHRFRFSVPEMSEQQAFLQHVIDESSDCIKVLNMEAQLLSMNAGGQHVMEVDDFSACELAFWPTFWEGENRAEVEAALDAARQGKTASFQGFARTFKGTPRWWEVTVSPLRTANGKIERLLAVSRDITARMEAERALSESQSRLRFALEAAELGDWELDLRDHSSWRSLQHDTIFGYPQGHATWTYETFLDHVVPEHRDYVDQKFQSAVAKGEAWDIECRVRRADGQERWIWTRARALQDQEGNKEYMLGVVKDITNLKRAEEEVRTLNATLEQRVEQRTQALEAQTASLDAFVAYTEAVGTQTEPSVLIRQALAVIQTRFSGVSAAYYEFDDGLWKAREWTLDLPQETLAVITSGLPSETPLIAQTLRAREAQFADAWDAQREQVRETEQFGSIAAYPLMLGGEVVGLLSVGLKDTRTWSEPDKALVRAVGRSLNLALERADQSVRLAVQNAELEARTRALEAFASLTRDLTLKSDVVALIRRAQEVVMSMLPDGHAAYYELEGQTWRLRSIVGQWGSPGLQQAVEGGLPYDTTRNFIPAWTQGQAHYLDVYDTSIDNLGEATRHFGASAVLPVIVNGERIGVFAVALFDSRVWTNIDKAVLESVVRSLGLAIEGARSLTQLAQRTEELERSNRDLEQFAYVASHDLQEPLRTITSFTELLARRYQGQLDSKADRYIHFTVDAARRMSSLIQDLLAFSRVGAENHQLAMVDTSQVLEDITRDLAEDLRESGAVVSWDSLPSVYADPVQIRQLLQNLVSNGIKFQREGMVPAVHISGHEEGQVFHFQVQDNGIGIDRQYFDRIFTVFQRLHNREKYKGTGVGLALCKRIVERHGGRLWLESKVGAGSTFHFTLPVAAQESESDEE
ncbi:PAS domain S-box protein [Deinococcus deserti]|uniref:histidine kinase n=1 Tax=Deinococcus deserti (strain DSM 17065 / CIP 109153 / LMG 22923 / VCD115) TaxID=546414 RepID=C1CZD9_DEIDV|nr:PAS domain S-box protein [Deinococcus deserti]ACO47187.2 putative histidine kinase, classic [Deinococcus deserti VCD115]